MHGIEIEDCLIAGPEKLTSLIVEHWQKYCPPKNVGLLGCRYFFLLWGYTLSIVCTFESRLYLSSISWNFRLQKGLCPEHI